MWRSKPERQQLKRLADSGNLKAKLDWHQLERDDRERTKRARASRLSERRKSAGVNEVDPETTSLQSWNSQPAKPKVSRQSERNIVESTAPRQRRRLDTSMPSDEDAVPAWLESSSRKSPRTTPTSPATHVAGTSQSDAIMHTTEQLSLARSPAELRTMGPDEAELELSALALERQGIAIRKREIELKLMLLRAKRSGSDYHRG